MGAACCVAAKGRTVTNGSPGDSMQRHVHYSPSWSFRWDNRGRVAGEETHSNFSHDGGYGNGGVGVKFGTNAEAAFASDEGSPIDSSRSLAWNKSPLSEGNSGALRDQSSDQAISQSTVEVKESSDSPPVSYPSPVKLSPSVPSVSSTAASPPLSSQSHPFPPNSTPSRWHHLSPANHPLHHVSDSRMPKSPSFSISEEPSLFIAPSWGNDSTRGSNGGSSDSWSIPALSDLGTNRRERWSFDSEASGFSRDKITRCSGHSSGSPSVDLQTCGICTKLLTDRTSLGLSSHKIMYANELAVVSVLTCGHVYHSECLEYMTSEISKYDPACPVCTFGDKLAVKMTEKVTRAEVESKARKRSRNRVVDSNPSSELMFNRQKSGGRVDEKGGLKLSSSSMRSLARKPFLKRHLSFGSKTSSRPLVDNQQSTPRKGFFWARSSTSKD
ncbi:hypothetical protein CASFOL_036181 [Castilleja foliolosa]|uniref:RING-type domain-containing protein n=1 Tax=Castilleja foliolosa TaxID=1961234 RepID=A0ABD3BVG2_9LAMI